jgi:putative alpha-1,2-mannosidase
MSAWYILSALGFYPLDPASGEYELGTPLVDGATLRLGGGTLKIAVRRGSPDAWRVYRVTFNGREIPNRRIAHSEIVRGGTPVFDMGGAN